MSLLTDLHTHFSGNVSGRDTVNAIRNSNGRTPLFPAFILDELKIPYPQDKLIKATLAINYRSFAPPEEPTFISLRELDDEACSKLGDAMDPPADKLFSFDRLERIYDLRRAIALGHEGKILGQMALDYQKQGIKYVEISTALCFDPKWIDEVRRLLPGLERKTGVKIRFLAPFDRHNSSEQTKLLLERLERNALVSPYITGVDIAGKEDNPTPVTMIDSIACWMKSKHSDMTLRIHAGETSDFPDNVYEALKVAEKHKLHTRLGHAIYGLDERAAKLTRLMVSRDLLMIEMNPVCNDVLGNVCREGRYPQYWLDLGVPIVLGSDGYGIFKTTSQSLMEKTTELSGNTHVVDQIEEAERRFISRQEAVFRKKQSEMPRFIPADRRSR